jgi:hypothetical protein
MSKFTQTQRASILAEARANVAKRESTSSRQPELVYKTRTNAAPSARVPSERSAAVASGSSEVWWQWVDKRIDAGLEAAAEGMGQAVGEFHDEAMREIAALKRELDLTRDEVRVLREQLGLSRELAGLRSDVAQARAEVPRMPAIAAKLQSGQERLERELEATKKKLTRARADQFMTDVARGTASRADQRAPRRCRRRQRGEKDELTRLSSS